MFLSIMIILFSINVIIYMSIKNNTAHKLLKSLENSGIPPYKFIAIFDKMMFFGSFIMIFLGFVFIIKDLFI